MAAGAEDVEPHHRVVHQVQTGISADDDLVHIDAEQLGEEVTRLGNSIQTAVVAGVDAVAGHIVVKFVENPIRQVELSSGRLAARHVKFQILRHVPGILPVQLRLEFEKFRFRTSGNITTHNNSCCCDTLRIPAMRAVSIRSAEPLSTSGPRRHQSF